VLNDNSPEIGVFRMTPLVRRHTVYRMGRTRALKIYWEGR
jgi:hypothetical protein